jgi:hypothetical protein
LEGEEAGAPELVAALLVAVPLVAALLALDEPALL